MTKTVITHGGYVIIIIPSHYPISPHLSATLCCCCRAQVGITNVPSGCCVACRVWCMLHENVRLFRCSFPTKHYIRCLWIPVFTFSDSQNISQLEIFGDMSTPPDITSPSVSSCHPCPVCFTSYMISVFLMFPVLHPTQTPASPANTLDPSQGPQPPTELFAPFNPASVPSGKTLFYV